jgi:hypothetical protein
MNRCGGFRGAAAFVGVLALSSASLSSAQEIGPDDFRISDAGPDGDTGFFATFPAVAHNSMDNQWLVVWQGRELVAPASVEDEIFGQLLDVDGNEIGVNDFRISTMGPEGSPLFSAFTPSVAHNPVDNEYLVVWWGNDGTGSMATTEMEVFGQLLDAGGDEIGPDDFRISDMGPDGDIAFGAGAFNDGPHVVHNPVSNEYLVVWQGDDDTGALVDDELEIFGQRLDASGNEIGVNDFRISDMGPDGDPSSDAVRPDVAHNPISNEYLVVWQGDDSTGGLATNEAEIFCQRLDASGDEIGVNDFRISDMGPDGDPEFNAQGPAVAHSGVDNEYLVVWWGDEITATLVTDELEVFGQRLDADGNEIGANDFRISQAGPDGDPDFLVANVGVAHSGVDNSYLVTWQGTVTVSPLFEFEAIGQFLRADGTEFGPNDFQISDMGPAGDGDFAARTPWVAHSDVSNESLVVWWGNEDAPPLAQFENEIYGQRVLGEFTTAVREGEVYR